MCPLLRWIFSGLKKTLLQPVNDVAVCCNVFKMRTAEEQLRHIEKCLRPFGKKMVGDLLWIAYVQRLQCW